MYSLITAKFRSIRTESRKGFHSRTVRHHRRKSLELLEERLERVRDDAVVAAVRHDQHLFRLVEVPLALLELVLEKIETLCNNFLSPQR